jgi:hypothetical protein
MLKKVTWFIFFLLVGLTLYGVVKNEIKESEPAFTNIDFSFALSGSHDTNHAKLKIPKSYNPTYIKNSKRATFYITPTKEGYPFPKLGTENSKSIRVTIRVVENESKMKSVYKLARAVNEKIEGESIPYLVGIDGEFTKYHFDYGSKKSNIGTYYLTNDANFEPIIISDPGEWSVGYHVYRRLNSSIELDYIFTKKINIQDWFLLDNYILEILKPFQSPYNKEINKDT